MTDFINLLKSLTDIDAVSGREEKGLTKLEKIVSPYFDTLETTNSGNMLGYLFGKGNSKRTLLIDAHFDQVGFMVSEVLNNGFLKVINLGLIDPGILPASTVTVHGKKDFKGVFTSVPPHLQKLASTDNLSLDHLYIDVGQNNKEELSDIAVGDVVSFSSEFRRMKNNVVSGRSFDNRLGITAVLSAIKSFSDTLSNLDIIVLFSSQEETTKQGIKSLKPDSKLDFVLVVDTTVAYIPGLKEHRKSVLLNHGPSISYSSKTNRAFTNKVIDLSTKADIPFQIVAEPNKTDTNADWIERTLHGVPTALISIPIKNMHTPNEIASLFDLESTTKLLREIIVSLQEG